MRDLAVAHVDEHPHPVPLDLVHPGVTGRHAIGDGGQHGAHGHILPVAGCVRVVGRVCWGRARSRSVRCPARRRSGLITATTPVAASSWLSPGRRRHSRSPFRDRPGCRVPPSHFRSARSPGRGVTLMVTALPRPRVRGHRPWSLSQAARTGAHPRLSVRRVAQRHVAPSRQWSASPAPWIGRARARLGSRSPRVSDASPAIALQASVAWTDPTAGCPFPDRVAAVWVALLRPPDDPAHRGPMRSRWSLPGCRVGWPAATSLRGRLRDIAAAS